ncbi:MAG: hypothetical protein ACRENG_31275 [bacterium]
MNHRKVFFGALFVLAILASSLAAGTGVVIVATHTTTAQPDAKMTNKTYVDSDRMRMEAQAMGGTQIVIFRQDKSLFWIIDEKSKTYMEFTKQDFQQMKAKMNEAKTAMDEQTKHLTPEQKQMLQKVMQGRGMPTAQSAGTIKTAYKKSRFRRKGEPMGLRQIRRLPRRQQNQGRVDHRLEKSRLDARELQSHERPQRVF